MKRRVDVNASVIKCCEFLSSSKGYTEVKEDLPVEAWHTI